MKHLVSSWNAVSKKTIANCFKKSNISQSNQQAAVNDDGDSFKSLQKDLERLYELDNAMLFNQIYQLNHLLIWIVKLTHLLLSLMMMISSPKLLKGRMKRAKMIKMMKKVRHQRVLQLMNLKTRLKRFKKFLYSVRMGTEFAPLY